MSNVGLVALGWAGALTVVFLIACWVGVLLRPNWKRRRHRRKQMTARRVFEKLATIPHPGQKLVYLRQIDPLVFEELVLEAFERRGHEVFRSASYSGDGGVDGRVSVRGRPYLVQCKRYSKHISKQHVLAFAAILDRRQVHGLFCHTGRTGEFSRDFHKQHPYLTIISGEKLVNLLTLPSTSSR
ncbi:restriction endonuclease [Pseudomonas sp. EMN2]|uniref:restriction endonuclease n=1 Tax=Pseudomonas sp. EMN2 TaxID=2615212 RepID=UPI00129A895E|nr:restriction endonuclease [Pseudomonas sp. EMN2]